MSLDFVARSLRLDAGENEVVQIIGHFADQQDVPIPFDYLDQVDVVDETVARLTEGGVLSAVQAGDTVLQVGRGTIAAATTVSVGVPSDHSGFTAQLLGIDAYPNSVSIPLGDGEKQITVSLGLGRDTFITNEDGVQYFVGNSQIITVTEDGLVQAVGEGETTVTVVYRGAEETITVKVEQVEQGPAQVDEEGAIVESEDGYQVAIGPGLLDGAAAVNVTKLEDHELPLPVPPYFNFAAAFNLNIQGANLTGPVQVAAPVDPAVALPGEEVYFFRHARLPVENGELRDFWVVMDSGIVSEDGIARTSSPPFPGLSSRGDMLIAKAAQPVRAVFIDLDQFASQMVFCSIVATGMAAVGGITGGVIGLGVMALPVLPFLIGAVDLEIWRSTRDDALKTDLTLNVPAGEDPIRVAVNLPPLSAEKEAPTLQTIDYELDDTGTVWLTIKAGGLPAAPNGQNTHIVFDYGDERIVQDEFTWHPEDGLRLEVPNSVLLTLSDISVETNIGGWSPGRGNDPVAISDWRSSGSAKIANKAGLGFIARNVFQEDQLRGVEVIQISREKLPADSALLPREKVIKLIEMPDAGTIWDTVVTDDFARVFVATDKGVAVIDGATVQLHDLNVETEDVIEFITHESGDSSVNKLALDPNGRYLYASTRGAVHVIDIAPGSETMHQIAETISVDAPTGYISSLAVNADGTRLLVAAPNTQMHRGGTDGKGYINGGRLPGKLFIINLEEQIQAGQERSQEVLSGGLEPFDIEPTVDPEKFLMTERLGGRLAAITDAKTAPELNWIRLDTLNRAGIFAGTTQKWDVNINYPAHVAVSSDLQYAFVSDWNLPRSLLVSGEYQAALVELEERVNVGSKVGVVRNPFGISEEEGQVSTPTLIASTTPIPLSFLEDVELSSNGQKLYANFRSAANIAVYDTAQLTTAAEKMWKSFEEHSRSTPIDVGQMIDFHEQEPNLKPIDITRLDRGLSLQITDPLELKSPAGVEDIHGGTGPIVFKWKVDPDLLPSVDEDNYSTRFFISSQPPGKGLWPDDPIRDRAAFNIDIDFLVNVDLPLLGKAPNSSIWEPGDDSNPNRIFTSELIKPDPDLKTTEGHEFEYELDASWRKALTAGQQYYWGVQIAERPLVRESTSFTAQAIASSTPFKNVTVLSHGMILDLNPYLAELSQPAQFTEIRPT